MPRAERPYWTPALPPGAPDPPTLRSAPPTLRLEPGDEATIATPLAGAATLPRPRLVPDELPTLRAAPGELAELIELTRRSSTPPAIQRRVPELGPISEPPVRQPDSGQTRRQLQASSLPVTLPGALPSRHPDSRPTRRQLQGASLPVALPVRQPDSGQTRRQPQRSSLLVASTSRQDEQPSGPSLRGSPPSAGAAAAAPRNPAGAASAMMPTQLWLGPVAEGLPRPPQRRGFWARLWTFLGLSARPRARPFPAVAAGINGHAGRLRAARPAGRRAGGWATT